MKHIKLETLGKHFVVTALTTYPKQSGMEKNVKSVCYSGFDKTLAETVRSGLEDSRVQYIRIYKRGCIYIIKKYTDSHFYYNKIKRDGRMAHRSFQRVRKEFLDRLTEA